MFEKLDKIKPLYDGVYKVVLVICKLLLIADILITSFAVLGRYIPAIPDPSWSEEVVLTLMSYMAVLSAALAIRRGAHIKSIVLKTDYMAGAVEDKDDEVAAALKKAAEEEAEMAGKESDK